MIDKQSFAFTVKAYEYDVDADVRTITDIDKLYDVSVVDQPFYEGTDVAISRNINDIHADEFLMERQNLQQKAKEVKDAKEALLKKLG